ncbi:MAG: efflux transporter outer membrane subunit [Akkermansiaceae bacterium]|nr:efflux transporter outer membrane subunit [Akkermansiaceae bacterium]NNM28566.1 efflux transporter outer membrane subunit [Akkermansiaceae bacterium]
MLRPGLLLIPFLLTGCAAFTIGRPSPAARVDTAAAFIEADSHHSGRIATGWLREFNDPRMTALVREAIRKNNNLRATAKRLRATREGTIVGGAARLPSINAGTAYSRTYDGLGPGPGVTSESYSLSLNASWEADLWGRLRDLDEATYADYVAAVADYRGARLSLAANTARSWINLITAQQQLDLAEQTLANFKRSLSIIDRRYRSNLLRPVDVQFGRNNVASAERSLRIRTTDRNEAARSLELLLGRYPAAAVESSSTLPTLQRRVPVGLPAGLVARRPDLTAARYDLLASAKRADADRKDLLPSLVLTGSSRNASDAFRRAIDPAYLAWSAAASLAQTVYAGGAPSARARAALARNRAEIHDYAQAVLIAFREVESALESDDSLREQEVFLLREVEQATLAERQSERDLAMGIEGSTVLEILEAQRRAVNARAALIRLRNDRLQNRIDLHLALGGDFDTLAK